VRNAANLRAQLPEKIAELIAAVPGVEQGRALALVCSGFSCQPPITSPEELRNALQESQRTRELR
jgi:uncharacterized protein YyaL (SSP411 family)